MKNILSITHMNLSLSLSHAQAYIPINDTYYLNHILGIKYELLRLSLITELKEAETHSQRIR